MIALSFVRGLVLVAAILLIARDALAQPRAVIPAKAGTQGRPLRIPAPGLPPAGTGFAGMTSHGIASTLRGVVVDGSTRLPIVNAEVRLSSTVALPSVTRVVRTNERGVFNALLDAGEYDVRVRAIGYAALTRRVSVGVAGADSLRITLSPVATTLDAIVVTAARREQFMKDVVVATELVGREEIARSGSSDLASLLVEHTGIQLESGHPAGEGLMLQGLGSQRVLILLDGHPLTGRIAGVLDVSRIPTAIIERIEIVKGPQSTLYGSDAMGGVINVITRSARHDTFDVHAGALMGSEQRRDLHAHGSYGSRRLATSVDLGLRNEGVAPGVAFDDGALGRRTDLSVAADWQATSAVATSLTVLAINERQRWKSSGVYSFSDNTEWNARLRSVLKSSVGDITATLSASVYDHLSRASVLSQPIAGDPGDRQLQSLYGGEVQMHRTLGSSSGNSIDVGAQFRRDAMETDRIEGGSREITTWEPFAQTELAITRRVSIVAGARASVNSLWGTHVTPRVAARLNVSDAVTLRLATGSGYRAPDFKEQHLFFQNLSAGYAIYGNPDLTPEESRNYSAGVEWNSTHLSLRAQFFDNQFSDFIETQAISAPGEPLVFQYQNISNGSTRGADFEAGLSSGALRVEAGFSLLQTKDNATGHSLLGRPENSGRVRFAYSVRTGTHLTLATTYTGRTAMQRDEVSGLVTNWRDAFVRSDFNLSQRVHPRLDLMAGIDNILDDRPDNWADFTQRRIYLGVQWSMLREAIR